MGGIRMTDGSRVDTSEFVIDQIPTSEAMFAALEYIHEHFQETTVESLRDRFAMAALTGILTRREIATGLTPLDSNGAVYAYAWADAMLAEREKQSAGTQRCSVCGDSIMAPSDGGPWKHEACT